MLRKIITSILWTLAIVLFAGYFVVAEILRSNKAKEEKCCSIETVILDSAINRFVTKGEVYSLITESKVDPLNRVRNEIDIDQLETMLTGKSAIKHCNISIDREGKMRVEITQRRPLIRIQTPDGGFYVDEESYIFPVLKSFSSYVPIVSGKIPLSIEDGYRGYYYGENKLWLEELIEFGTFIKEHPLWDAQIQQIEVCDNLDINLYNRIGDQKIVFGQMDRFEYKFAKLECYYKKIVPVHGWEKYSEVNLKFSDQIVCTKRSKKKK
jgi:cell division protein FtsQ